ncbi:LOW QUALITY PROTEIN: U4/U6 small nuclear ribonucleoprotein PRP4-like protein [Silene latifolia]|uniref:LOW QUALITY PROTEIN: U4/U6 small nuclear ribonucleoprotein PRP4-like protein n=1 Tax=Silene latifolia TaxID=37657 RepID=UPI003D78664B
MASYDLSMNRRATALAVPTNDIAVRTRLSLLGEPITLFGERQMERRDRLRTLIAKLDADGQLETLINAHEQELEETTTMAATAKEADEFYTVGSKQLLEARKFIAKFSIRRASNRLQRAKSMRDDTLPALNRAATFVLDASEIGGDRPLTGCSFSKDGNFIATCSLNGNGGIWNMPQLTKTCTLKGHTNYATDIAFSPVTDIVATASADQTACLWDVKGTLLTTFTGHADRLTRIAFHPSGDYLATASFDNTWRMWDINTATELLLQEGHSRGVYGICFHPDGSLAASCGLDSRALVWDLRTGKNVLALEEHVKPILGIDFSPNGYQLATGGEDNTCRIWDLRKKTSVYIIPAHLNLISKVKFEPQQGYYLVTGSYDMTAKIWLSRDFKLVRTLFGHEAKVTSLDISGDGQHISTVLYSYDRTVKLWRSSKVSPEEKSMDID